jgi:hypothetical protein
LFKQRLHCQLAARYSYNYTNQYDLHFLGCKVVSVIKNTRDTQKLSAVDEEIVSKAITERTIKTLQEEAKLAKLECKNLLNQPKVEECKRMDLGRESRRMGKSRSHWDAEKYQLLKEQRNICDGFYSRI